jgi:hypothetical protein
MGLIGRASVAVVAALVLGCATGPDAGASSAVVTQTCDRYSCTDLPAYTADPGERNSIRVDVRDGIVIEDTGAVIRARQGCTSVSDHVVRCEAKLGFGNPIDVDAGDMDDALTNVGGYHAYLDGGPGDDTIVGGVGSDYVYGGGGRDVMTGGEGSDYFSDSDVVDGHAPDSDSIDGGPGRDSVDYQGRRRDLVVDLIDPGGDGERGEGDRLIDLEGVSGGTGDDVLYGDDEAGSFFGGGGDDRIRARGGDDELSAGQGRDRLDGGAGDDEITTSHLEALSEHDPVRVVCGPGDDEALEVHANDLVGEDCERANPADWALDRRQLMLPLAKPRGAFFEAQIYCDVGSTLSLTARVSDRRAPAGGLLGHVEVACPREERNFPVARLRLSREGARYLRRVRRATVTVSLRAGSKRHFERGGFRVPLRYPE